MIEPDIGDAAQCRGDFRFGLVCTALTLATWQATCIEQLLGAGGRCVGVILTADGTSSEPPEAGTSRRARRIRALADWAAGRRCAQLRPRSLRAVMPDVSILRDYSGSLECPTVAQPGGSVDFVLRFHDAVMPERLPWAPQHGVWSFDHDGPGGLKPGTAVREHRDGSAVCGTALRRRPGQGGNEDVLCAGTVRAHWHSLSRTRDDVLHACDDWVLRSALALTAGVPAGALQRPATSSGADPLGDVSTWPSAAIGGARAAARTALGRALNLFTVERWNIGIVNASVGSFLDPTCRPAPQWLPSPPRGRFLADPSALTEDTGGLEVLAEELDYSSPVGRIVRLRVPPSGQHSREVLELGTDLHLSYPFPVKVGDATYCLAECHRSFGVPVWQVAAGGETWKRVGSMLDGLPLVDPTVFRVGSRWWLFAGHAQRDPQAKLYAWYADSPLGPWRPHLLNPIKTDVEGSRPAGAPFSEGGVLYRPAQDCSRTYGGAVAINEIIELDVDRFEERLVTVVRPYPGRYPHGLHTFNAAPGGRIVVDGKRHVLSVRAALRRLARRIKSPTEIAPAI